MKQTLVLLGILCLAGMISWQQKSNEVKSLEELISESPDRQREFNELVKAHRKAETMRLAETLDPEDEMNDDELEEFRQAGGKDDSRDDRLPTLRIATTDVLAIVGDHTDPADSLVFYKGKYPKDDKKRLKRYNKKFAHGQDVYTYDMLKNRKTFVVRVESSNPLSMQLHYRNPAYDVARLCPPPRMGCD